MPTSGDHQVIKFRPRGLPRSDGSGWQQGRGASPLASRPSAGPSDPDPLRQYESNPEEPDDYRHRMIANVAAGVFVLALTAIGIWLAVTISDLRKTQDCVLYGRRDCGGFPPPPPRPGS